MDDPGKRLTALRTDGYPLVEDPPVERPARRARRASGFYGMLWDGVARSLALSCLFCFVASAVTVVAGGFWAQMKTGGDKAFALFLFPIYNACLVVGCAWIRKARIVALLGVSLAGALVGVWFVRSIWMNVHPRTPWNPNWRELMPLLALAVGWIAAGAIVQWWPRRRAAVYDGVRCVKCGYSLAGLPLGSTCPECGEPMADCRGYGE